MPFELQYNNFPAGWRRMINRWGELNSEYFEAHDDLPAWYVESSNAALLAVAAWQCGYPAICEVDIEKIKYNGRPDRPGSYTGRLDMALHVNGQEYWLEAKRRAFALSKENDYSLRYGGLSRRLREALVDVDKISGAAQSYDARLVAAVFFSGHIEPGARERKSGQDSIETLVSSELSSMHDNMSALAVEKNCTVFRAVFTQDLLSPPKEWNDHIWPAVFGICAVIK